MEPDDPNELPPTINSSPEDSPRSKSLLDEKSIKAEYERRAAAIATSISRLALHYWRPDLAERHAKLVVQDFIEDLSEFSTEAVEDACRAYRRDPGSKHFPKPGELRSLAAEAQTTRFNSTSASTASSRINDLCFRPALWWLHPENHWKTHWKPDDIPEPDRTAWYRRRQKETLPVSREKD